MKPIKTGVSILLVTLLGLGSAVWASGEDGSAAAPASNTITSNTIKGLRYVSMTVSDIDDTLAFYGSAIDFPVVKRYTVDRGSFPAELLGRDGHQASGPGGCRPR